ncbi:MAG: branched-chain amino acid ABC transporter permease [Gaiellaceae bacterium]
MKTAARIVLGLAVLALLVAVPQISLDTHGVFSSDLNSPGTLQLLGLMLVFGGVALSYDLLFGFTGLLSFGHALYFAVGVYLTAVATTRWEWGLPQTLLLTAVVGLVLPLVLGSISLRVGGIAFAMVTLAFAEAGSTLVDKNPRQWTGAEEGVPVNFEKLPEGFIGVLNTDNLYWVALAYLVAVFLIVNWVVDSSPGRIWQAIRENEQRVEVLGLHPFRFKLLVFVLASFLATAGGVVYVLLIGSATPGVTTPAFTLALLLMVVIGGAGTRWGAIVGGALYTFLEFRLPEWSGSKTVQDLPGVIETPLSEPLFVLGTLFVLLVFFVPGGIAGLVSLRPRRGLRRLEQTGRQEGAPGSFADEAGA